MLRRAFVDGRPGWRWGADGPIHWYWPGNSEAETEAKMKAIDDGLKENEEVEDVPPKPEDS